MIKVGIEGADTPLAGELIRILINHPDVIISQLSCSELAGISVSTRHHGLIGEEELKFTRAIDYDSIDTLFICRPDSSESRKKAYSLPELNVIDLSENRESEDFPETVFGLSEIYRKNMVRGAKKVSVPYTIESMALVSLFPLALNLLLSDAPEITVSMPEDLIKENRNASQIISQHLAKVQQSFNNTVTVNVSASEHHRVARMKIQLNCPVSADHIKEIYNNTYDDHNFTFLSGRRADESEVNGTEKCILYLNSSSSVLEIEVIADARMRGGAGEAVHIMNLLNGLHEKTGLSLKSTDF